MLHLEYDPESIIREMRYDDFFSEIGAQGLFIGQPLARIWTLDFREIRSFAASSSKIDDSTLENWLFSLKKESLFHLYPLVFPADWSKFDLDQKVKVLAIWGEKLGLPEGPNLQIIQFESNVLTLKWGENRDSLTKQAVEEGINQQLEGRIAVFFD